VNATAAPVSNNLIDQYKSKLMKAQQSLDAKIRELQYKDSKMNDLQQVMQRNDKLLKKTMNENQNLKKQVSSGGGRSNGDSFIEPAKAKPAARDFKTMRAARKENAAQQIEEFNQKFLNGL